MVVDGFGVDEGDGEAPGSELGGEVDSRDDVALERVRNEEGVRRLPATDSHCYKEWDRSDPEREEER